MRYKARMNRSPAGDAIIKPFGDFSLDKEGFKIPQGARAKTLREFNSYGSNNHNTGLIIDTITPDGKKKREKIHNMPARDWIKLPPNLYV